MFRVNKYSQQIILETLCASVRTRDQVWHPYEQPVTLYCCVGAVCVVFRACVPKRMRSLVSACLCTEINHYTYVIHLLLKDGDVFRSLRFICEELHALLISVLDEGQWLPPAPDVVDEALLRPRGASVFLGNRKNANPF